MKTMRPDLKSRKQYLSLLDIKLGTILELDNEDMKSRYVLAGMSLTGYALVCVYDNIEICNYLSANPDISTVSLTMTINNVSINTYTDCSRIITCRFGIISNLVKENPACYAGQLTEAETEQIIQQIKSTSTISQNIKNEYFI
jgi:hypothetical protein